MIIINAEIQSAKAGIIRKGNGQLHCLSRLGCNGLYREHRLLFRLLGRFLCRLCGFLGRPGFGGIGLIFRLRIGSFRHFRFNGCSFRFRFGRNRLFRLGPGSFFRCFRLSGNPLFRTACRRNALFRSRGLGCSILSDGLGRNGLFRLLPGFNGREGQPTVFCKGLRSGSGIADNFCPAVQCRLIHGFNGCRKGDFFQLSAKCKGILAQSGNSGSQLNGLNIRPVGIPGIAAVRTAGHLAASGQGQRPILQGPGAVFPPVSLSRSQGMGPGLPICTAVVRDIVLSG